MMVTSNRAMNGKAQMKIKLMPILMGAIALTGSITAISLPVGATPLTASTQANPSGKLLVAQAQPQRQRQHKDRFADLNLTQEQKDKIAQIRKDAREQMKGIITQEQRDKYKAAMQSNQNRRAAYAAMNLSEAQKTKLKQIKQSTKSQIEAILTPAQRQQLQQKRQELRQQRNQQRNSNQ